MPRLQNWPEKLAEQVALAQEKPYVLGEHDCLRFACHCIEAVTGVNHWPKFKSYSTVREALREIAERGGDLGTAALKNTIGAHRLDSVALAQRGDVVIYEDERGEHLGVCVGASVALLKDTGLSFVGIDHFGIKSAWRVD